MNIVVVGSCLVASALFLGACQGPSSTASSPSATVQQFQDGDPVAKHKHRCCRKAGRNGNS